jgi:hypothetical protein
LFWEWCWTHLATRCFLTLLHICHVQVSTILMHFWSYYNELFDFILVVCLRQKNVLFTLTFSSTTHTIFIGMIGDMDTWISYSKLGSRHVIMPCQVAWGWKWLPTYQWWHFMHTTWHVHMRSHSFTTIVSFTRYKDGPQSWSTINVMAHPSIQEVIHTSHHTLIVTLHYSKKNELAKHSGQLLLAKGIVFYFWHWV